MRKPLDLGNGLVCASLDQNGAWLSLGTTHSRHGFVELTALPRFDERRRGDPEAVRRYRRLMTESRYAFLRLHAPGWRLQVSSRAPVGLEQLEQRVLLTAEKPNPVEPILCFQGALDRPPFAEITEVNPLPPTRTATTLRARGRTLQIDASELPAVALIQVTGSSSSWEIADGAARLVVASGARVGDEVDVLIACSLRETQR